MAKLEHAQPIGTAYFKPPSLRFDDTLKRPSLFNMQSKFRQAETRSEKFLISYQFSCLVENYEQTLWWLVVFWSWVLKMETSWEWETFPYNLILTLWILVQSKERRSNRWRSRSRIQRYLLRPTPDWHKHQEHPKRFRSLPHQVNLQQHLHPRYWSLRPWNLLPYYWRNESQGRQRRVISLRCYACRRRRLQRTPGCWHQRYSHKA